MLLEKNIFKWYNLGKNTFLNRLLAISVKEDFEKERIKIFFKSSKTVGLAELHKCFVLIKKPKYSEEQIFPHYGQSENKVLNLVCCKSTFTKHSDHSDRCK